MMDKPTTSKLRVDMINLIYDELVNMRGNDLVIKELIQNADDAPNVTVLEFEVDSEKLTVRNNGVFRDEDFEHITKIASGGKRDNKEMTGFFGIGFISTYIISNYPQIRSATRQIKFIPRPDISDVDIELIMNLPMLSITEFTFPWAIDDKLKIREALGVPMMTQEAIEQFFIDLQETIPPALLFLKKLDSITIRMNDTYHVYTRKQNDNLIIITQDNVPHVWQIYSIQFETIPNLNVIKQKEAIPNRFRAQVSIALPTSPEVIKGLYYCTLPTAQMTELPFHINGDLRVDSKRKSISEFQFSDWNLLIYEKAVECFCTNLMNIYNNVGEREHLWVLLSRIFQNKKVLDYWLQIKAWITSHRLEIFSTMSGETLSYGDVICLQEIVSYNAIEGIVFQKIISKTLAEKVQLDLLFDIPIQQVNFIYFAQEIMPKILSLLTLETLNLDRYNLMINEIIKLRDKELSFKVKSEDLHIAVNYHNEWCSSASVWKTHFKDVAKMLHQLGLGKHILLFHEDNDYPITQLIPQKQIIDSFDTMMTFIQRYEDEISITDNQHLMRFLNYLENKLDCLNDSFCKNLGKLKIWPTQRYFETAKNVYIAGIDGNPLALEGQIKDELQQEMPGLLKKIGIEAQKLCDMLQEYKSWFNKANDELFVTQRPQLLYFLQSHSKELDNDECRTILSTIQCVKCSDGRYHCPSEMYFTQQSLLEDAPYVHEGERGIYYELYKIAGVSDKPRLKDIVNSIRSLSEQSPSLENAMRMKNYALFLAQLTKQEWDAMPELKMLLWLPGQVREEKVQWYAPQKIYANQNYALISTAAVPFLTFGEENEKPMLPFLKELRVIIEPPVNVVCQHLIIVSQQGKKINGKVYQYLQKCFKNDPTCHNIIIESLKDVSCIMIKEGCYIKPSRAFWSIQEANLGTYLVGIGTSSFSQYKPLFCALGVRQEPTAQDVMAAFGAIADDYILESNKKKLVSFTRQAWQLLEFIDDISIDLNTLSNITCIPTREDELRKPSDVWLMLPNDPVEIYAEIAQLVKPFVKIDLLKRAGCHLAQDICTIEHDITEEREDKVAGETIAFRINTIVKILLHKTSDRIIANSFEELLDSPITIFSVSGGKVKYFLQFPDEPISCIASLDISQAKSISLIQERKIFYHESYHNYKWDFIAKELLKVLEIETTLDALLVALLSKSDAELREYCEALGYPYAEDEDGDNQQRDEEVAPFKIDDSWDLDNNENDSYEESAPDIIQGPEQRTPLARSVNNVHPNVNARSENEILHSYTYGTKASYISQSFEKVIQPDEKAASRGNDQRGISRPSYKKPIIDSYNKKGVRAEYHRGGSPESRLETDIKGMEIVMQFEREYGRTPFDCSFETDLGYDIESQTSQGKIRYIEVKSCSGAWDQNGIAMRNTQMIKAFSLPTEYFLYVVEFVYEREPMIHIIQNPVSRLDLVFLGDEFKKCAEHFRRNAVD